MIYDASLSKMTPPSSDAPSRASTGFLAQDFDQAFLEKRRFQQQLWDVCKFAFTMHSAILGLAIEFYRYSPDTSINVLPAVQLLLGLALLVGSFLVFLMIRTRVYFVIVTRYINAQRAFFLSRDESGFVDPTGYYSDSSKPDYLNWTSTQTVATLLVALFNAVVLAPLVFLLTRNRLPCCEPLPALDR